ncbi:ABC transporter [Microbacterium sp. cx-55]|uniref:ABC transporter n=1 Tax=Microbacterium sp. cx-55 TaxID=2875948 RepID=UPI001CBB0395|nr:ABC transporter [Microbacterium sp. cx-55]MBZ4487336.1 ABC transporter [Microbacterium sp. cx-55]UGB35357.1 ABC transporter [Microbacterium sp. cx-55]
MRPHPILIPTIAAALLALTACAGPASAPDAPTDGTDTHGAVSGAAEMSEPQLHLMTVDPTGAVAHLDLLTEESTDIGGIGSVTTTASDGRYLFAAGDGVRIVDSGVWTWDHVDHFHYYRAEPRILGTVPDAGAVAVATTNSSTTGGIGLFFAETGAAVLLDTASLSKGEIVESFRLNTTPHAGYVVPVGSFALVTDGAGAVTVHESTGDTVAESTVPCVDPRGTITTRVGAVLGCRDGALLATVTADTVRIERIPYPEGVGPVTGFANREGRPTVAGLDAAGRILLLDTRERSWRVLPSPAPLLTVTAVDDAAEHVLGLGADGRVLVIDGASGALLAATEPLVADTIAAGSASGVRLIADDHRAYLNAPVERLLYEIDYADAARIARTFVTPTAPVHLVETGR